MPGRLRLRIAGDPAGDGGVLMRRSAVTLGPPGSPGQLQGRIVSLQGSTLEALVGTSDGRAERLRVDLELGDTERLRHGDRQPRHGGEGMSGLPRLLAGCHDTRALTLDEHAGRHGLVADARYRGAALIDEVASAGLRGRGGAAFPTAVKLRAVAARRGRRAIVVNAAEGEPLSAKDRTLLELAPHLVLDGALLAAEAVGAREIVLAMKRSTAAAHAAVSRALAERHDADSVRVRIVPDAYLAGEETALIRSLNGGPMKPTLTPPRPDERGLGRRPTLVSNAETLAHMALIARQGARWFRELGTADHPGSALVTVDGAVERPAVYEIALGMPLADVIATAGRAGTGAGRGARRRLLRRVARARRRGRRAPGRRLAARARRRARRGRHRRVAGGGMPRRRGRPGGRVDGGRERRPVRPVRARPRGDRGRPRHAG